MERRSSLEEEEMGRAIFERDYRASYREKRGECEASLPVRVELLLEGLAIEPGSRESGEWSGPSRF